MSEFYSYIRSWKSFWFTNWYSVRVYEFFSSSTFISNSHDYVLYCHIISNIKLNEGRMTEFISTLSKNLDFLNITEKCSTNFENFSQIHLISIACNQLIQYYRIKEIKRINSSSFGWTVNFVMSNSSMQSATTFKFKSFSCSFI